MAIQHQTSGTVTPLAALETRGLVPASACGHTPTDRDNFGANAVCAFSLRTRYFRLPRLTAMGSGQDGHLSTRWDQCA